MKTTVFEVSKYHEEFWIEMKILSLKNNDVVVVGKKERKHPEEGWTISGSEVVLMKTTYSLCKKLVLRKPHEEPDIFVSKNRYLKYRKFYQNTIWYDEEEKIIEKKEVVSPRGFYDSLFSEWGDVMGLSHEKIKDIIRVKKDDYFDGHIYMASPNYIVHFESGNTIELINLPPEEGEKYLVKEKE